MTVSTSVVPSAWVISASITSGAWRRKVSTTRPITSPRAGGRVPGARRPYPNIHETAEALGLGVTADHHLSQCPACSATGDGSASVFDGARRWKCHR